MAMTGFFYTFKRPRAAPLMGLMKYDPIGTVLPIPMLMHAVFPPPPATRMPILTHHSTCSAKEGPVSRDEEEEEQINRTRRDPDRTIAHTGKIIEI